MRLSPEFRYDQKIRMPNCIINITHSKIMHFKNTLLVLFPVWLLLAACDTSIQPPPPSNSANIIMPLGASRVEGARPEFESYRYELWKLLVDGSWDFDFIGTVNDPGNYPEYAGQSFDAWNEGHGGFTSGQILEGLPDWLEAAGSPDIVLFSSPGGNDGLSGQSYQAAVENVNDIIDLLQANNPNVTIIIEQMAPAMTSAMTTELSSYMERMNQEVLTMAEDQTTATSKVLTVDMFTGFNDSHLADDVHYNEAGAAFIAERYYTVLEGELVR